MTHVGKILCLGNETEDTDIQTSNLAKQHGTLNHGLVQTPDFLPDKDGYYHTSVLDINEGQIRNLAKFFDKIIWLDQPQDSYPHWKTFLRTFRLIKHLEQVHPMVEYVNNQNSKRPSYWWNYLRHNLSFCHHPFLSLIPDDSDRVNICSKVKNPIKSVHDIVDWHTDPDFRKLRDNMLAGKKMSWHCYDCYDREKRDIESTRQFETLEWAIRMKFDAPEDFDRLPDPVFYEVRPGNKCNLMCRMCDDARSHLIEKESKQLGKELLNYRFENLPLEKIQLENVQRIYFGGGEPTIMPEFFAFLQYCIDRGKTDFELCIGTNGVKFSNKLIKLLDHFPDVILSFSFDGYGKVNDYIRWKSKFSVIHQNAVMLRSLGHKIGLQTVPSMYNLTRLHELFEFYDEVFPDSSCLVQGAGGMDLFRPWNHPLSDLVVSSMEKCMKTNVYLANGRSCQGYIEGLHAHYSNPNYKCDLDLLKQFFEYNDQLDRARGSKLEDYIPELEQARKFITN